MAGPASLVRNTLGKCIVRALHSRVSWYDTISASLLLELLRNRGSVASAQTELMIAVNFSGSLYDTRFKSERLLRLSTRL